MKESTSFKSTNNLNAVDIAKFICAMLVVSIHTNPLLPVTEGIGFSFENTIARIAVPFFFMTSGYLFYSKINKEFSGNKKWFDHYLLKYLRRILLIYLFWCLIYLIYDIHRSYEIHQHIFVVMGFYIRNFIFLGGHFHLWYFPALIVSITILYFGIRILSLGSILLLSIVCYVIGLFGDSYFGLIKHNAFLSHIYTSYIKLFVTTRNGLFFGFFYVTLGAFLFEQKLSIKPLKSAIFTCLSIFCLVIEVFLLNRFTEPLDYNMMLSLIPASYFLFHFLINIRLNNLGINYKILRETSTLIYCSHGIFLIIHSKLISFFGLSYHPILNISNFLFTFISSLLLSLSIIKIGNIRKTGDYIHLTY